MKNMDLLYFAIKKRMLMLFSTVGLMACQFVYADSLSYQELGKLPTDVHYFVVERKVVDVKSIEQKYAQQAQDLVDQYNGACVILEASTKFNQQSFGKQIPQDEYSRIFVQTVINHMKDTQNPDYEKAAKDFAKGKLHKSCREPMAELVSCANEMYNELVVKVAQLKVLGTAGFFAPKDKPIITVCDTILNPAFNIEDKLNFNEQRDFYESNVYGGWEWTKSDKVIEKVEHYPVKKKYLYYESHPEYTLSKDYRMLFDKDGKLIRIISPREDMFCFAVQEKHIYKDAYLNNEYNIQNASPKVKHHIKVVTELEPMTNGESAKIDKEIDNIGNAYKDYLNTAFENLGNSKKEVRARNEASKKGGKVLMQNLDVPYFTSEGFDWMQQIKEDKKKYFFTITHMKRIDDLTLSCITRTFEGDLGYKVILKAQPNGPFDYNYDVTIEDIRKGIPERKFIEYLKVDKLPEVLSEKKHLTSGNHLPKLTGAEENSRPMQVFFEIHCPDFIDMMAKTKSGIMMFKAIVETDGTISGFDYNIEHSVDKSLRNKVEQIMRLTSGLWTPGTDSTGAPVRSCVYVTLHTPKVGPERVYKAESQIKRLNNMRK